MRFLASEFTAFVATESKRVLRPRVGHACMFSTFGYWLAVVEFHFRKILSIIRCN